MAAEVSSMPVNGNYAPHQGFGGIEQQQNNYTYGSNTTTSASPAINSHPPPTSSTPATGAASQQSDVPKDEVGWYFVEQYYTTLSRNPEKLYLFYNKRSQFVSGQETDKVPVCVGQRAINDRIKELDFHDCKVRVTNVDSQASDTNIVIQVIGEISNKSQPHKKFTQTFVLATQTNGYFVLNDIFRYIVEEEDEPEVEAEPVVEEMQQAVPAAESEYQEPVPAATEVEPKTLTSSIDPAAVEHDSTQMDRELENKLATEEVKAEQSAEPKVNGVAEAEPVVEHAEDEPLATNAQQPEGPSTAEVTQPETKEEDLKPEKPKDPEPTRSASPPKQAPPQPAPPPKAAAPKTWASLAASANRVATPGTPSTASSNNSQPATRPTPPSGKTSAAPTSNSTAIPASSTPSAPAVQRDEPPTSTTESDEWTAVGSGHNRQQSRQTNPPQQETPQHRGYIKNVYEIVDSGELKTHLEEYGEITYIDISRQKVEFPFTVLCLLLRDVNEFADVSCVIA